MARRILASPALAYALLAFLAFPITELLFFGEEAVHFIDDVLDAELPIFSAFADDLARGQVSLWNPDLAGGNARLAQMPMPPTTPEVWLGIVLPALDAYLLGHVVLAWVAGYGMHRFLRDALGLPVVASAVGGILYMISFWHYVLGISAPLLPMLLWLTDRFARAQGDRRLLGAGLVVLTAVGLYVGHIQLFQFMALIQLGYLVAVGAGRRTVRRDALAWLAVWVVAVALFAPVLLTQLTHLADSHRSVWDLEQFYPGSVEDRVREALDRYRTVVFGVPIDGLSRGTAGHYGTWFAGSIGLPLLLAGLFVARPDPRARYLLGLIVGLLVIDLVATAVAQDMDALGPLRTFQLIRVRHFVPFAVTANVAIGLAALAEFKGALPRRVLATGAGAVGVGLVAWQLAAAAASSPGGSAGWSAASVALAIGLTVAAAVIVRGVAVGLHRPVAPTLAVVLILLVIGERTAYVRAERLLDGSGMGTWAASMEVDPARAYIAARAADTDRMLTVGVPESGAHPNHSVLAGLSDAGGYQTTYPLVYHGYFGVLTAPYLDADPARRQYFHGWGNRAYAFGPGLDPEVLDLTGVRWIYASALTVDAPDLEERYRWAGVTVYENLDPFPRAAVVPGIRVFETAEDLQAALATATIDELAAAAPVLASDWTSAPLDGGGEARPATIIEYHEDVVRIRADATAPSLLVLTDTWDPGWTAEVDGRAAEVVPVYRAFRGVRIPAGTSDVVFEYRPVETYAGLGLAGVAALGLAAWTAMAARDRRRSGAHPAHGSSVRVPPE